MPEHAQEPEALAAAVRQQGLFLSPAAWSTLEREHAPAPLYPWKLDDARTRGVRFAGGVLKLHDWARTVLVELCGLDQHAGSWDRTPPAETFAHRLPTGEAHKPDWLWHPAAGDATPLPVFLTTEKRLGVGRGRKAVTDAVHWLRAARLPLAVLSNGHQWRLVSTRLDAWSSLESEASGWTREGREAPGLLALRTLLQPATLAPAGGGAPLVRLIAESREGQTELSAALGENVRTAVELLIGSHTAALKGARLEADGSAVYRAACRMAMRLVVVLFAEAREMLPLDNPAYAGSYGLGNLQAELDARAGRLRGRYGAWPRVLALFRLVHGGSHHEGLPLPAYGGELFEPADAESDDPLQRALRVFETACFAGHDVMPDETVARVLAKMTRAPHRVRQGRGFVRTVAPVNFADLGSEYIGILYEGLLDYELKLAPDTPVVFLPVGHEPALPLDRLVAMSDRELKGLFEAVKKDASSTGSDDDEPDEAEEPEEADPEEEPTDDELEDEPNEEEDEPESPRELARRRAEAWGRKAVEAVGLVRKPKGKLTPERADRYREDQDRAAAKLVKRLVLPGEFYLVRWGGTRKGSGTFYTRPGLAIPTVRRTLGPLCFEDDDPSRPRKPEEILALRVCDPACGSGSFPVAALRYLTAALVASVRHHGRLEGGDDGGTIAHLLGESADRDPSGDERLAVRDGDDGFEERLEAVLKRHVVERCLYGVDLDPLAVELCRLALWIETLDRSLPFSFLDHKIRCGNALLGTWFDRFAFYPAMAWKNRQDGDEKHTNGVHFKPKERQKKLKAFEKEVAVDLAEQIGLPNNLFTRDKVQADARTLHGRVLAGLEAIHALPVHDSAAKA